MHPTWAWNGYLVIFITALLIAFLPTNFTIKTFYFSYRSLKKHFAFLNFQSQTTEYKSNSKW